MCAGIEKHERRAIRSGSPPSSEEEQDRRDVKFVRRRQELDAAIRDPDSANVTFALCILQDFAIR